ncbi:glutathione S-transferase [Harpegnathos saltator]|uniref:glutathione transferase n=1 Tax=Harpegnathos saltator TaxID=610380 RepID=E2C1V0_HARSA|nr:glutathione S-transferase [Harpegnathos saltator]EFN78062.1 Glutathione S-transferase [Harpegnathos saltator]
MPTYKLIYFNITGLGEPIRYMFHHCGIEFEDVRIEIEDWPKRKADMPMGQVPVLEIDGRKYHQSRAISRYLAKHYNLYGADGIEAMEIDTAVDSIDDLRHAIAAFYWEQDPVLKEKFKKIAFEKLPFYLDKFEEQVKKNSGHFVRGKLSWADFVFAAYSGYLSTILVQDTNKDHPELKKLVAKVNGLPNIKAYLERRPKTIA